MNLSETTRRKITAMLLAQFLEKQRVLVDTEVTLASVSTSWESLLNFQGYALPSEDKAPAAIIVYDATTHKRVVADCERNRDEAKADAAAAYAELLEVLNA